MDTNQDKEKRIKAKIVLRGAGKYRKKNRQIKAEVQELNEVVKAINKNLKQLNKSMKKFNELRR